MLNVKVKKFHTNAVIPSYAKAGDAGLDLTATTKEYDANGNVSYGTGLGFEIPDGYVGLLFPRSSNSKQDLILTNSVGVIDSGYRGEVSMKFKPAACYVDHTEKTPHQFKHTVDAVELPQPNGILEHDNYEVGDRIGQILILPYPQVQFIEVDSLSETERGAGGYGSSGK